MDNSNTPRTFFACYDFQLLIAGPNGVPCPTAEKMFNDSPWGRRYHALMTELHSYEGIQNHPELGGLTLHDTGITNKHQWRRAHGELERVAANKEEDK